MYVNKEFGTKGTEDYCVFFEKGGKPVSPWHDIPLRAGKLYNMVVEIPRGSQKKMEIDRQTLGNPIRQDIKDGRLREVSTPYPFNYGALCQTWEDPSLEDVDLGTKGDSDPLDVCELSSVESYMGEVKQVKVLGCYAMIDDRETDWKIVCLDANDPLCDKIESAEDLIKYYSSEINECFEFLRDYKIPDGKGPNKFGFEGKLLGTEKAKELIEDMHQQWKQSYGILRSLES